MNSSNNPAPVAPDRTLSQDETDLICIFLFEKSDNTSLLALSQLPVWVENQSLHFGIENPPTPYPFGRLAWTNVAEDSSVQIYHQLSNDIIVEDTYVWNIGWNSTNISVVIGESS